MPIKQYKTRNAIHRQAALRRVKVEKLRVQIIELGDEMLELQKQDYLLSDKTQQYKEEIRAFGRGKKKREFLCGVVYWDEDFVDEDTGDVVTVQRSQIVRRDGEWII